MVCSFPFALALGLISLFNLAAGELSKAEAKIRVLEDHLERATEKMLERPSSSEEKSLLSVHIGDNMHLLVDYLEILKEKADLLRRQGG